MSVVLCANSTMKCAPQLLSCTHIKWRDNTECRKAFDSCFYSDAASSNANANVDANDTDITEANVDDGQGRYDNGNERNNNKSVRQMPTT